ncbi:MAG: glyoxalase/bleomycin resistance/extradiol dioxygenase family protein [Sulfurovum sp.]|jgi:catechol 2,3-dioxygenase-like lactoylglutathione lyase family enzyme|nr:MAG: glyoxalase/bleomycin resistance/extradiol dioxygenase family protein [Sulfurovum sp.]
MNTNIPYIENNINLNLLVLRCKNIEISKEFYEKLHLNFKQEQHGNGFIHYSTQINELVLELYPLVGNSIDNIRLGFKLNVQNLKDYLTSQNIEIISHYDFNNSIVYVVLDPDGRKIELQKN